MAATVAELLRVLDLERIEDDIFRGVSPATRRQRVFGGQVLGQALVAAARTVGPDRRVHSLHAYFVRPGDPAVPIAYVVERVREGRAFSTRRVVARQHGRPIFQMSASFQVAETGVDHQVSMPPAPAPDTVPTLSQRFADDPHVWPAGPQEWAAIDVRLVDPPTGVPVPPDEAGLRVWLRADGSLPDDPALHAAVLAFASDLSLLTVASVPHGLRTDAPGLMLASIDHAMWFHRDFRADDWLLHVETSPSASGARGMGQGRIYTADGRLVATTVQEGLVRFDATGDA